MSLEYRLALLKPVPNVKVVAELFADFGGVEGSLKSEAKIGTTSIQSMAKNDHDTELFSKALREAGHSPLGEHQLFAVQGGHDLIEVGAKLVAVAGGAFITEDGELFDYSAAPAPRVAKKKKAAKTDVSIPRLVRRLFATSQAQYCLYARKDPDVRIQALVRAANLPAGKSVHSRYESTLATGVGQVHLNAYQETEHWAHEYAQLGLDAPVVLYRTAFEYWHVQSVPQDDWNSMLGIVCGLARSCDGVLYRPDGGPRFDFTLPEEDQEPTPTGEASAVAEKLLARAKTATGDALAEALEGLARISWTAALDVLDFDDLCRRTDRAAVESTWKFLQARR